MLLPAFMLVEAQHCKHPHDCPGHFSCPAHEYVDCLHDQCTCSQVQPAVHPTHPTPEPHHCKQAHECTGHITCVGTEHVGCQLERCVCVKHTQRKHS
ncbi:hypothetical protein ACJMK2_043789 [Sinanodonta woodiana]|uniref:Uncharacterized protein n=1 Tax=Sinanodonta woodiana TaxID=1069815 RepID=A0ABD3VY11_SINWO